MPDLPQTLVVAGVSGSGKTAVSAALAARTGASMLDADDFHPPANVAKMAGGQPLTDADREPWIDALVTELRQRAGRGERVVLACSALRARHRRRLLAATEDVVLVHLDVSVGELRRRLAGRVGHFMPADLLQSQLAALEPPDRGDVVVVDGDPPVSRVVEEILRQLVLRGPMPLSGVPGRPHDAAMADGAPSVHETHISWVLLTGDTAYKIMKPVRTDVVDQGDIEARRAACRREIELNARLAPDVYRGVGSIRLDGDDLEPVIVMWRMPEERRLTALLDQPVAPDLVREVARRVAAFHAATAAVRPGRAEELAAVGAMRRRWRDDLDGLREATDDPAALALADELDARSRAYLAGRAPLLDQRIVEGMVRDGHGDLLADDIFCLDDGPRILDCLAFDETLRTVDVLADVGFLVMDLQRLGHDELAERFLDDYVEFSGEHHPGSLAHLHVAQRALVRAKVAALRTGGDRSSAGEVRSLLELAADHLRRAEVRMVLVGGLPGAGKTTLARGIGDEFGFVVLSSDEQRRDLGLRAADVGERAYRPEAVRRVYDELLARARSLLVQGVSVVVDATWTDASRREDARRLAADVSARVVEVRCEAPVEVCRSRIAARPAPGAGDSEAVPATVDQLAARADPWPEATTVDTSIPLEPDALALHRTWWRVRMVPPSAG